MFESKYRNTETRDMNRKSLIRFSEIHLIYENLKYRRLRDAIITIAPMINYLAQHRLVLERNGLDKSVRYFDTVVKELCLNIALDNLRLCNIRITGYTPISTLPSKSCVEKLVSQLKSLFDEDVNVLNACEYMNAFIVQYHGKYAWGNRLEYVIPVIS